MFKKLNAGFSLLEVLIALLILSIGLLGIAGLQIKGQQYNQLTYLRTQAIFLAYDIMDRMRVNSIEAENGTYAPTSLPSSVSKDCDDSSQDCTTSELATYDLVKWQTLVQDNLLNSEVEMAWDPTLAEYTITIKWQSLINSSTKDSQEWKFQP